MDAAQQAHRDHDDRDVEHADDAEHRGPAAHGLVDPWMRTGLVVSAVAILLLAAWLIRLRADGARLSEEVALLRRRAPARGEVA
jgi:hypothetical protein